MRSMVQKYKFVAAQSMAANITSRAINLDQVFAYSIQAVYTTSGTLGGTFTLEASVDHSEDINGNTLVAGNWVTIEDSDETISGAGTFIWNVSNANYPFVRLVYTKAMGDTGTLNAFVWVRSI